MKRGALFLAVILLTLAVGRLLLPSRGIAERTPSASQSDVSTPVSQSAIKFASSAEVASFSGPKSPVRSSEAAIRIVGHDETKLASPDLPHDADKAMARISAVPMPTPILSFDGLSNYDNINAFGAVIIPPDMNGDIGPNHYVQAVNALVRIFDRTGSAVTPPFKMSQLFAPLGTQCAARDDGLPIVQYDQLAGRWLISQYCNNFPPFRQLVAVSKTGDPTGEYYLWEFVMPSIRLNDFAKFGVWPDGYYMSTEEFTGGDYSGAGMFAFDRAKMLAGDPSASFIYFNIFSATPDRKRNMLPSDLDGLRPPLPGTPNVFVSYTATEYGDPADALRLFDFHADFAHPELSTFTERSESPLAVAAFDPTSLADRFDIIQPAPGERLDANSDRLNYRAAYRSFGSKESIVLNQTVRTADGEPYRGGVRVYELNRTTGPFAVRDNSTIGDSLSTRWIGGVAQDNQGNLAVSYNHVTETKPPSIRYTGRLANEPIGTFRTEAVLMDGTGVQKAFGWRWGDYNAINVDPNDDCTFWTTGEYYTLDSQNFSDFTWLTRIGTFKFDECTPAPRATITGTVTNAAGGQPIVGALVRTAAFSRSTGATGSYGDLSVLPDTYSVTASAHGFTSQTFGVTVANGQTATQNFVLQPIPLIESGDTTLAAESCSLNGSPDPGENVTVSIPLRNTGMLTSTNLTATLQNSGGVINAGAAQNYGSLAPNSAAVSRNFTFTVDSALICGSPIVLTIALQDATGSLGQVTVTLQSGKPKVAFRQNFDRTMLAALPPRWTRSSTDGGVAGSVSMTQFVSQPKSLFAPDPNQIGLSELVTPTFLIATANARITFNHRYDIETTFLLNRRYDGSVLEIKIGNGAWADVIAAGGAFESGGYDGPIDTCCNNPLAGRPGWSGRSGIDLVAQWETAAIRLPAAAAGQPVQMRWRMGTDVGNSRIVEGEFIDDIVVTDGYVCSCGN